MLPQETILNSKVCANINRLDSSFAHFSSYLLESN